MSLNPAFPCKVERDNTDHRLFTGLTKREYFAAKALEGELASQTTEDMWEIDDMYEPARRAVAAADALISALNKE